MIFTMIISGVIGFLSGAVWRGLKTGESLQNGIDIYEENKKLRKENQVLWVKLKDEGKVDKF